MVQWHIIDAATYYAADPSTLSDEKIYFLSDTKEIYRGATGFTEAVVMYTGELPATPARKKIYVNTANGEGKVYTGNGWATVIAPIDSTVVTDGTNPVNSKAVIEYVTKAVNDATSADNLIASVAYTPTGAKLTVTNAAGTSEELVLSSLGASLDYDSATGKLSLKDVTGAVLGSEINLDLERFVKSGSYDPDTGKITLVFNDDESPVEIPVGDLVDTYTAKNSGSIRLTVTNNEFVAEAIASAADGNVLEIKEDGLYVAACDLSDYMHLVADADTTALPMLNAQGQVINGTYKPGGASIAETPTATVLATELAVNALVASTKATIDASITALSNRVTALETLTAQHTTDIATAQKAAEDAQAAAEAAQTQADKGVADAATAQAAAEAAAQAAAAEKTRAEGAEADLAADITELQDTKLDKTDVVALTADATEGQAADAKATYEALTWKTSL